MNASPGLPVLDEYQQSDNKINNSHQDLEKIGDGQDGTGKNQDFNGFQITRRIIHQLIFRHITRVKQKQPFDVFFLGVNIPVIYSNQIIPFPDLIRHRIPCNPDDSHLLVLLSPENAV